MKAMTLIVLSLTCSVAFSGNEVGNGSITFGKQRAEKTKPAAEKKPSKESAPKSEDGHAAVPSKKESL